MFGQDKITEIKVLTEEEKVMKSLDDDTLLGPDKNDDGVRDDVESFIDSQTKNEDARYYLKEYAKYSTLTIIQYQNTEKIIKNFKKSYKSSDCLNFLFEDRAKIFHLKKKLRAKITNTKERILASSLRDQRLSGWSDTPKDYTKKECER